MHPAQPAHGTKHSPRYLHQSAPPSTSSGTAAHFDEDIAVNASCHELAERDAFMIVWLRKASPPAIDIASLPEGLRKQICHTVQPGWRVRLLDLTTNIAPVIAALVSREGGGYLHGIGASSHDDVEKACLKAVREAAISLWLSSGKPRPATQ